MSSRDQTAPDSLVAARPELADLVDGASSKLPASGPPRGFDATQPLTTLLPEDAEISTEEIEQALGEPFYKTLDVAMWDRGLSAMAMDVLEQQIVDAVRQEDEVIRQVRDRVLPEIERGPGAPAGAGLYTVDLKRLEQVQHENLFNGGTAAVDGSMKMHDTLPLTVIQIGIALVTYANDHAAWTHRVFRRDLRSRSPEVTPQELIDLLQNRRARGGLQQPDKKKEGRVSELLTRGLMSYSERAILADEAGTPWRMGHGQPAPYELLTGSGNMELLRAGLDALRRLVLDHERFVYVPSADGDRLLLTLGMALHPMEFAVVHNDYDRMKPIIAGDNSHLRGDHRKRALQFLNDAGPKIVVGIFRTYAHLPPQVFYAHADHAQEAAVIAMADSVMQAHRGFPMLIDLADTTCRTYCGMDTFGPSVEVGYARSGSPLRYFPERQTRR